jgi:hypothetical protein
MEAVKNPIVAVDVWQAYREAFDDFAQKVRQVQLLAAHPGVEQQAIDQALLDLETAHALYNATRDSLAEQFLPTPAAGQDIAHDHVQNVKDLAALRWEMSGRPEGTAEDDWYRAEEIVSLVKPGCC